MWCSCRGSALEIHRREACERPVSLRFSALRSRVGTNQQCDACEGLVRSGKTGVSTALNAVRERSAVKVACSVLRGPRFREGTWLPSKTVRSSEATSDIFQLTGLRRAHPVCQGPDWDRQAHLMICPAHKMTDRSATHSRRS